MLIFKQCVYLWACKWGQLLALYDCLQTICPFTRLTSSCNSHFLRVIFHPPPLALLLLLSESRPTSPYSSVISAPDSLPVALSPVPPVLDSDPRVCSGFPPVFIPGLYLNI